MSTINDKTRDKISLSFKSHEHSAYIKCIEWSPTGRFFAVCDSRTIRLWDADKMVCFGIINTVDHISKVSWNKNGTKLASTDGKSIFIWNLEGFLTYYQENTDVTEHNTYNLELLPSIFSPKHTNNAIINNTLNHILDMKWSPIHDHIAFSTINRSVFIYDVNSCDSINEFHEFPTASPIIQFSNSGDLISIGHGQGVWIWDLNQEKRKVFSIDHGVYDIAWTKDDRYIITGHTSDQLTIWDVELKKIILFMEGHTGSIRNLSLSNSGLLLATSSEDNTVRIWSIRSSQQVFILNNMDASCAQFDPTLSLLITITSNRNTFCVWNIDENNILLSSPVPTAVKYTSAKIVLVGESNVGKSCLAMRLAENRYPNDNEHGSTHGVRFWLMDAEDLHTTLKPQVDQRRDIILWDLGGQNEYRLIHQLFLDDTTLALILIDPSRGRTAFDDAKEWSNQLEKHITGKTIKLLVGSKQDQPNAIIDKQSIIALTNECNFSSYHEVSAKNGRNIKRLRKAIAAALDWDGLAKTSRPELFQNIRDEIERLTKENEIVVLLEDLTELIRKHEIDNFESDSIKAVTNQLAIQGIIAKTKLSGGEDALVLQVPIIEKYAGSLIVAARNNPRGVPALEERILGSKDLPLPGISTTDRIPWLQERVILECVIELMIKNGICYRHQGLIIFPTLLVDTQTDAKDRLPHSVSLYYDFTGAIDNIYASLVSRLVISEEFGKGRLYPSRFEFDAPDKGICGIQHLKYKGGLAHIDLYFAEETTTDRRDLFTRFVENHLREYGVEVSEHQAIKCRECKREIDEEVIHANIASGQQDVICQWCRTSTLISDGVAKINEREPLSEEIIFALRKDIENKTVESVEKAKKAVAMPFIRQNKEEPITLLHLSDLHFTNDTSPKTKLQWLLQDLRYGEAVNVNHVEYLIISGDVTDRGNEIGFEKAREFVYLLNEELGISAERCIFVPGNHDLQDLEKAYDWYPTIDKALIADQNSNNWHKEGNVIFVPNKTHYPTRLQKYSDAFYHKIVSKPYPADLAMQGIPYLFTDTRIQFLTFNTCWQIDQFNRKRSSIHPDAMAFAIKEADEQIKRAILNNELNAHEHIFKIGIWHHSILHTETMSNIDVIPHLQSSDVKLCLHGDVHEMNRELFKHWHQKKIHVVGAGSFGSLKEGRPESIPRLYNIIEIKPDFSNVRVHTRRQPKPDGPWSGWNEWPIPDGSPGGLPWYDIILE